VIVVVVVFCALMLFQQSLSKGFDYRCDSCGHRFSPSLVAAALAPHRFGGLKLLRCPNCGTLMWASAVPKR
jgi:DNA-directed RNA polymerase subunit RPC12/RpoP